MDTIADWRKKIDELDRKLVELINERAKCAKEIGRLKRNTEMPIYEPERERVIFQNIAKVNRGPLTDRALERIYERLIEAMRNLQGDEILSGRKPAGDDSDNKKPSSRRR
jgi:chorismate mutase